MMTFPLLSMTTFQLIPGLMPGKQILASIEGTLVLTPKGISVELRKEKLK